MSLADWIQETTERYSNYGIQTATRESFYELIIGGFRRVPNNKGDPVWDDNWDVLCILDACRHETFEQMFGGTYDIGSRTSVGANSSEWMRRTFREEYASIIDDTAYVSGNPFSNYDENTPHAPETLSNVWENSWDEDIGTIHPQPLIDEAIRIQRNKNPNRIIIHFMQPHFPSVPENIGEGIHSPHAIKTDGSKSAMELLRYNQLDYAEVVDAYEKNLVYVMEEIERTLLGNIDGKVAFSADHGEMIGEYGIHGHFKSLPFESVRKVPWATVTSEDNEMYEPPEKQSSMVNQTVKTRLNSLGYD